MDKKKRQTMSLDALQLVAARFKVLSDPMRLRILQFLESGETSVSALAKAVESTQPNVSKHLKTMQDAGLLARRQEGNTVYYSIADPTVFDLCDVVCSSLAERFAAHASAFSNGTARSTVKRKG
ncbi:MAG: winged helix-turn-helix transcriptional regulator [Acidobacteria bacterium]|nr:winged helix-turn-helix transcriptional regulator [Acidobacteriota bacterium]